MRGKSRFRCRAGAEKCLFPLSVFLVMLVFFTLLHPIPIMDGDDVIYTVVSRKAVPRPGEWNPTRMMPELLMGLCGNLAGLAAAAGWGSFIDCQITVLAAMLSVFITGYAAAFRCFLERHLGAGRFSAACLTLLFLLMHFLVFRTMESGNLYMFFSYDACCVFYYTISALFCCTLILLDMTEPFGALIREDVSPARSGFLLLALYCAVFSNLHGSVILASWFFLRLVMETLRLKRVQKAEGRARKKADTPGIDDEEQVTDKVSGRAQSVLKTVLRENGVAASFLLLWVIALALEATGGRAASTGGVPGSASFTLELGLSMSSFAGLLGRCSLFFRLLLAAMALLAMLVLVIRSEHVRNRRFAKELVEAAVPGGLSLVFILLLCAASDASYAGRPQVMFPVFFSVFLMMTMAASGAIRRWPAAASLLPLAIVFCFTMTNTRMLTFADSNPLFVDGHVAAALENSIYGQIIDAAKAGETEVTVLVPESGETVSNWPHDGTIAEPMVNFFLKFGLIDHEIAVQIVPSAEVNRQFHIPDNPVLR